MTLFMDNPLRSNSDLFDKEPIKLPGMAGGMPQSILGQVGVSPDSQ